MVGSLWNAKILVIGRLAWLGELRRSVHLLVGVTLVGCASLPPTNPGNVCDIFVEKKAWYADAHRASTRWQMPVGVLMAFTYQESSYRANARPPRRKLLGFIPWTRPSAFGYAQATDAAWQDYTQATGRRGADRNDFDDAIDFVGWYNDQSHRRNHILKTDAYHLYLAYHEGHGGYARGSYRGKAWLKKVARAVTARAARYDRQLKGCEARLKRRWWWPF